MANKAETTFGSLEMDERYRKLERYLKLALLKEKHNKNIHNKMEQPIPTWPSISSINADTIDSSCVAPSLQVSRIESEVLASSNNLKRMVSKQKAHNINKEVIATSSVKQYNAKQDNDIDQYIMPPPSVNRIGHALKKRQNNVYASSGYEKTVSTPLNSSVQSSAINNFIFQNSKIDAASCVSVNTYDDKEYLHSSVTPPKDLPKPERVFSRWRVMLNNQHQLIIKGTLECGRVARSKPVIRRYSTTVVESIYKHQYRLDGNITDERNELPDYIRGKFYNGFPDDWENVYQIWRTFVSQGCLVTFRWPTPITDSDDDLKSEMTDVTYIRGTGCYNSNTLIRSYETIEPAGQIIQPKSQANKSSEKVEKCHNCTHSSQSNKENHTFVNSPVSDAEKNKSVAVQVGNASNEEVNEQNTKTNVNQPCSPRKTNKLKDFLQEDKLNIIINNLADRNCSPKYIDKIIEMFDCLDYVTSYRSGTECDLNAVSESCNTSRSEMIPPQRVFVYNKDNINDNNLEKQTELRNQMHSCDLGYGSIRNDTDPSQLVSNARDNVSQESGKRKDSDNSESETYSGVPKISIERVLQAREALRKFPKRKMKKKTTQPEQQMHMANEQHNANEAKHEFAVPRITVPVVNVQKKNPLPDESCVSITEEEVEETRIRHGAANIARRPQETTHHQLQRTDSEVHAENTAAPATRVRRNVHGSFFSDKLDFIQPQRIEPNIFTKNENSRGIQEKEQAQFPDVDFDVDSNVEKDVAIVSNMRKTSETESHSDLDHGVTVINDKHNNNFLEKLDVSRESRKEFVELPKGEATITRAKPTIISSVPVNINLKLTKADVHRSAHDSDVNITDNEDKQRANVRLMEETHRRNPPPAPKTSTVAKSVSVTKRPSPSKTTVNMKKENHTTSNIASKVKNESDNTNPVDTTKAIVTRRPKKQVEDNPKVLTAWVPKVVHHAASKTELGLTFRGKLLNEAGHIMYRNFTTDIVLRRLSPTLIETVNHEFYHLLGSLNDNKHVIPKELVKQCRHGCPAKIEQFCLMWKSLQHGEVGEAREKLHDATIDSLTVRVSSRGRKILPPLCYWTGERVTLKDNIPVYSLGNSEESSIISLNESPKKNIETHKKQRTDPKNTSKNNMTKQKLSPEKNEVSNAGKNQTIVVNKGTPIKLPKAKAADNAKKSRKSINGKRRIVQQLTFSSTDSDHEEEHRVSPRKRLRNFQSNANGDAKVHSRYSMTLRKRQKTEVSSSRASHEDTGKSRSDAAHYSPVKKSYGHNMMCAYYQDIPREDLLSEDQVSPM